MFDPLRAQLDGVTRLLVVPDALLARLPFAALPLGDGFLLDDYTIGFLMSGRDLCAAPPAGEPAPALVIGDPDFNLGVGRGAAVSLPLEFEDLPGTRREAERVAAQLGVSPVLGADAARQVLLDCRSPSVLHLSTHGLLLPTRPQVAELDPMAPFDPRIEAVGRARLDDGLGRLSGVEIEDHALRSMVALAGVNAWLAGAETPGPIGTGWINAEDIAGIELAGTRLVVLSACETGLGVIEIGEAVLGIRTAFLVAGAGAVVSTQWKVPDEVTADLMDDFYRRLLDGSGGIAEALRAAQLARRRRHPETPRVWGGFVCHGGTVRVSVQK